MCALVGLLARPCSCRRAGGGGVFFWGGGGGGRETGEEAGVYGRIDAAIVTPSAPSLAHVIDRGQMSRMLGF